MMRRSRHARATKLSSVHYNRALVPLEPTIEIPEVPIIADNDAMSGFNLSGLQIRSDGDMFLFNGRIPQGT